MPIAAVFAPLEPIVEAPLWVLFVTPGVTTPIIALAIGWLIKKVYGKSMYGPVGVVLSIAMLYLIVFGFQRVFESRGFTGLYLASAYILCYITNATLQTATLKVCDLLPVVLRRADTTTNH